MSDAHDPYHLLVFRLHKIMLTVYHSPKQGEKIASKEDASCDEYVFFPPLDNPKYMGRDLYWFSTSLRLAQGHADIWRDNNNDKWKLTLVCMIPETSNRFSVDCFCNVRPDDIIIVDKIWWR